MLQSLVGQCLECSIERVARPWLQKLQKLQKMAKTCILYHSDGLVIHCDEFSFPLCNLSGLVTVSRKFLSPFRSILHCYLSELTVTHSVTTTS